MRRPLCLFGLVYVAAVWLVICGRAGGAAVCSSPDGEQVVAGYVDWKEYRLSRDTKTPVIYLSDAVIVNTSQVTVLEQFLSASEKIPRQNLHTSPVIRKFWGANREKFRKEGTEEIRGVICYMEEEKMPAMGSLVMVRGSYWAFSHATNPGEFDAADYYAIAGQQGRLTQSRVLAAGEEHDAFRERLYRLREYLSLLIDACYEEADASVMKAMLLGEKGMLDAQVKELYRVNGILHILSISGLHLSIIGMGCHKFFHKMRLPLVVNIILCAGLMYCYGTMTGMGTSMLRAYVMFVMHLLAGLIGRTYDLLTAVTVSALIILLQQPLYLRHSGFLFSFGAVCGIGILLPAVERNLFGKSRAEKAFLSGTAVSLSTLPVYLCFYYEFPPYSVVLNLIVIPCMTLALLCGLASVGAAALWLPFGAVMALPVRLLLGFYEKCCVLCLRLPGHTWAAGHPALWKVLLFFGILLVLVVWNEKLPKLLFWQGMLCALLVFGIRIPAGLQITMVDVGQGDCIYLAEDRGVHMLIDGGSSDKSDVAVYQILPFLKYEGVSYLDAVVVTHPDSDHINGICAMLEEMNVEAGVGYDAGKMDAGAGLSHEAGRSAVQAVGNRLEIGALYLPDVGEAGRNEGYLELERLAARAAVPVRYIGYGDRFRCGNIMLTCLHPEKGWNVEDSNAYSTVLHLAYGDFTALFTGDLEGTGERRVEELVRDREALQNITLLKVAHHGSRNSTGEKLLRDLDPKIALLSAGRDNRYGHPHEELLERLRAQGCMLCGTKESGAVTVRVRGGKVTVSGYSGLIRDFAPAANGLSN